MFVAWDEIQDRFIIEFNDQEAGAVHCGCRSIVESYDEKHDGLDEQYDAETVEYTKEVVMVLASLQIGLSKTKEWRQNHVKSQTENPDQGPRDP